MLYLKEDFIVIKDRSICLLNKIFFEKATDLHELDESHGEGSLGPILGLARRAVLKRELEVAAVELFDGYDDLDGFSPLGLVLVVVDDGAIRVLGLDAAAQVQDARNGLAALVADANRHLDVLVDRLGAARELAAD